MAGLSTPTTNQAPFKDALRRPWPELAGIGIVNLALGVVMVSWPGPTVVAATVILGLHLMVSGVVGAVAAVRSDSDTPWPGILLGSIAMVVGLLVMRQPLRSLELAVLMVGVAWMFWGAVTLFLYLAERVRGRRSPGLGEAVVHLLGGAAVLTWPINAVRSLALVSGVFLLVMGTAAIGSALRTRSAESDG